ncbi:oligosaccharide flippase family protein [Bradyrhizobium sp. 24]|uniref:oligosaccharide flippase family protein n=1 Tax=unclassified Bradyrhizobium TaxID=2631580 RepID=UPI001FF9ECED|nr:MULTISPECIES: oligosaccharide flippase family protein [unclassified Bradyrhizobium]MCK1297316.1 oligosaccharide flippase family protein [Bradyrhizobium sp. 37]MCK1378012.1 oligosaccharide flippase family protein [Bradyrhizobium sp. 24]MCK1769322.1 oligosaccharide flippase family protein [Bradyrhizobium sp. 134]
MNHDAKRVASAIGWNLSFVVVSVGVQIGTTMLLGRLLTPRDYGIFAFANSIVVFGTHLSQRGLATTILRQQVVSARDLGNAYVVAGILAIGLAVLTTVGSTILRLVNGVAFAEQADLLLFMSVPVIFQLMATPSTSLLQRELAMVRVNAISVIGILVGNGGVAAVLAVHHWGAWSLAGGAAASSLVTLVLSLLLGRYAVSLGWYPRELRRLLVEAVAMNGLRALDVAWVQLPLVVLGLRSPASLSGLYQRTQFVADVMLQMTVWRVTGVLYAALASRGEGRSTSKALYRLTLLCLATLVIPIVAFVMIGAEPILGVLLGENWKSGGWMLRLLIVAFGISTINQAAGMSLELRARFVDRYLCSSAAVLSLVALIVVTPSDDVLLIAAPPLGSMLIATLLLHWRIGERWSDLPEVLRLLRPGTALGVAALIGALLGNEVAIRLSIQTQLSHLLLELLIAGILCCLVALPILRLREMAPFVDLMSSFSPGLSSAFGLNRNTSNGGVS